MGAYVNPKTGTKEEWLEQHGLDCKDIVPDWAKIPSPGTRDDDKGMLPVVLIDNGNFTAAGIAYSDKEYREFLADDGRPRRVFLVALGLLKTVSNVGSYMR
jgi:hypothetical protein